MNKDENRQPAESAKLISRTLFSLLREQTFSSLNVSQVCRAAGISRQTFYASFSSLEDVIMFQLNREHQFNSDECCKRDSTCRRICAFYGHYVADNHEFLDILVKNGILYLFYDSLYDSFCDCKHFCPDKEEVARAYAASFYANAFASLVRAYIHRPESFDSSTMEQLAYTMVSGKLQ